MNRIAQGLIVSLLLGLVACQSPAESGGPGVFLTLSRPAVFEARDITRVSIHHGVCQCTSPTPVNQNMLSCRMDVAVPSDCQCVIYSEADLVELILEKLRIAEDVEVRSVEIVNGTLFLHADKQAVELVAFLLEDIRQDCSR